MNKILIINIYIYLVYPTPTFCLQKWVEPVAWCRKSGAGPAAQKPPTMVLVCLVSSVNFFLTERGPDGGTRKGTCECAAFFTANTGISGCLRHQEGHHKYNRAGHTSVPVYTMKSLCDQDSRLYAHINVFIPRTSKRAASGPVPRSSHSQLKIHRAIYTAGLNSKCRQLGAKRCFEYGSR